MGVMSTEVLTTTFALIGAVIMVAALLSGAVEKSGFPQVAVFLAVGAILGPVGFSILDVGIDSSALRIVASLSLTLVLFTDAVGLDLKEVRSHVQLAGLVLGPGTILSAALIALIGWLLLGLPLAGAAILGAALASTDPVLLRSLLRRRDVPSATRQALRLESSLNDVVLLPIVVVAMEFLAHSGAAGTDWGRLTLDLFVLGPGAGVLVGLLAVSTLDLVRRRIGVRRDYEALYSLGVAFAAYAAAEAVHGSGFLAAFAAGLTITALDVELCDCFLEYGETTAEMALLFTFVLFGGSLIWTGLTILTPAVIIFAIAALAVRPLVLLVALAKQKLDPRARRLILWFGPRGLSSLLLVLLPSFANLPGSDTLFALCALVCLLSVVIHGTSSMLITQKKKHLGGAAEPGTGGGPASAVPAPTLFQDATSPSGKPPSAPAVPTPAPEGALIATDDIQLAERDTDQDERITIPQLQALWRAGEPVIVLDVRTERSHNNSDGLAQGAVRLEPIGVVAQAQEMRLPSDAWLIAFCA